ncbi:PEP-CTERM sorting domain-containing protein [Schlesneria sp. T3-172]|uniref:PEP-CTERM sorting domain-containing protein n=1 Tax=Schlesneria sphaerica TaxID=3373610 RepID=UPI0037C6C627
MNPTSNLGLPLLAYRKVLAIAFAAVSLTFQSTEAGLVHTYEAAGVQTSSAVNTTTINFDSANPGYHGSQTFNLPGDLTATYTNNQFNNTANQYGGAGGNGQYLNVTDQFPVTLTLTKTSDPSQNAPQAYFGMWISAADAANKIEFFLGNTLVDTFTATASYLSSLSPAYYGNPNAPFLGANPSEPYVFVNFYSTDAGNVFDKIVFTNIYPNPLGSSFESDNHTFSTTIQPPANVPEPSSFALLGLGGIGIAVGAYRRRRSLGLTH